MRARDEELEVLRLAAIRSLMTLVTLAVVFAYFTRPRSNDGDGFGGGGFGARIRSYGFWRSIILVGSAIPIAILTNALRVSGTGVLAHYYGTEVADGFFHSLSLGRSKSLLLSFCRRMAARRIANAQGWTRGGSAVKPNYAQEAKL